MPVTLPAHAAAILPLCHPRLRFLPPVALVVGSAAPDLSYLTGVYGTFPHSWRGLFEYCLPAGLAAYLWVELLILPLWRRRGPSLGGYDTRRFAVSRGLPRRFMEWLWVGVSLLLGATTHLLWDGLTHVGDWPERALFQGARVELLGARISWARILWGASSVLASLGVLAWWARRYKSLPAPAETALPGWPLWAAIGFGVLFGLGWRTVFPFGHASTWQLIWTYFWAAARYASVAVTALAVADRLGLFRALLSRPVRPSP